MSNRNRFKVYSEEEHQKERELEAQGSGDDKQSRTKIVEGLNVFWVLPPIDNMKKFYQRVLVHYGPFHACGRDAKREDPHDPSKLIKDGDFSKCHRCSTAWKTWKDDGLGGKGDKDSSDPQKKKFREDMSNDQIAIQVLNLTPFFKLDRSKKFAQVDEDMLTYMDTYISLLNGESVECDNEDIVKAAGEGVNWLLINEKLGQRIIEEEDKTRITQDLKGGPMSHPDKYLLQIVRERDPGVSFETRGVKRYGAKYNVTFTIPKYMEGWDFPEDLWDVCARGAVDLTDIPCEHDTVEEMARCLHKLTSDQMVEFLTSSEHTFKASDNSAEDLAEGSVGSSGTSGLSSPDDFEDEDDALRDEDNTAKVNALRRRRAEQKAV